MIVEWLALAALLTFAYWPRAAIGREPPQDNGEIKI